MANRDTSPTSFADLISMFVSRVGEIPGDKGIPSSKGKLFDGNVIPSKGPLKRLNPTLTSIESARVYNTGTILAKAFYDFNQKKQLDVKTSTIVSQSAKTVKAGKTDNIIDSIKSSLGELGGIILATITIATLIYKAFGPIAADISKFLVKVTPLVKSIAAFNAVQMSDNSKRNKFIMAGTQQAFKTIKGSPKSSNLIADSAPTIYKKIKGGKQVIIDAVIIEKQSWIKRSISALKDLLNPKLIAESFKISETGSKIIPLISSLKAGVFGKMITDIGTFLGRALGPILKKLPLIGALMSFTFAYLRYRDGKYVTSLLELLSGIFTLSTYAGFLPGIGISLVLDGIILLSDLLENKSQLTKASGYTHATKIGIKLLPMLSKIGLTLGKKLLKVLSFVPLIGGLAGLVLSYMAFKEGKWVRGTLELVSAIADFIPGVGTAVSWILDGSLLLYDLLGSDKKETKTEQKSSKSSFSFKAITSKFGEQLKPKLRHMPVIGSLYEFGDAFNSFKKGDTLSGIKYIVRGLGNFVGMTQFYDGINMLIGLDESVSTANEKTPKASTFSFIDAVKKYIKDKLAKLPLALRKPLEWLGIIDGNTESNKNTVSSFVDNIKSFTTNIWDNIKSVGSSMFDNIHKSLTSFTTSIWNNMKSVGSSLFESIYKSSNNITSLGSSIWDSIKSAGSSVRGSVEEVATSLTKLPVVNPVTDNKIPVIPDNNLDEQNNLIKLQNQLLVQLLSTSKEQLNAIKKQPTLPTVASNTNNSTSVNMNNAFSTIRKDGRSMYNSSPYSISPSFA